MDFAVRGAIIRRAGREPEPARDRVDAEERDYRDRARRLGLPFAPTVDLGSDAIVPAEAGRGGAFAMSPSNGTAYIAPDEDALPAVGRWLAGYHDLRSRLVVATPSAIRAALIASDNRRFAEDATTRLATRFRSLSARKVVTAAQAATGFAVVVAATVGLAVIPITTLIALNLFAAFFFFGVTVLRFIAAASTRKRRLDRFPAMTHGEDLPIYTLLVPLYKEAALVDELITALDRIDWPRERLDIKLIVEEDDPDTVAAAHVAVRGPPYEVIVVPPVGPRTKPKALAFAAPFIKGDYVTVYDAEDWPHPAQLREAHAAFSSAAPDLACLQSALMIDNGEDSLLAGLFAVEYASLFDGLLPTLAAFDMPLPLGGTSNHFCRAALEAVGGWDPFNVTEDADLGIRLARFGYRTATLELPTGEEAPARIGPWLRQRTRWFKGWMQTWLVHTRHPLRLRRELGWRRFLGFNLMGTGLIVSAMIHPIYLLTVAVMIADPLLLWGDGGLLASAVIGLNLFNLFAGYLAVFALARSALRLRGHARQAGTLVFLPFYWLLMSVASYRALFQLMWRPHHWEKTPHRQDARPAPPSVPAPEAEARCEEVDAAGSMRPLPISTDRPG